MYVGFELNDYLNLTKPEKYEIDKFHQQTKGRYRELSNYLINVFSNKRVIDAQEISNHIFPTREANIFLSHSHSDKDKAIELAVSLKNKGLSVFVDSCVWGYFRDLLNDLSKIYAEPVRDGSKIVYNYNKVTELTAGVHMMLTGALHTMIERSEIFIFLNTDNSVPLKDYKSFDRTFSPWIYSELQFSSHVERITPERHRRIGLEHYATDHLIETSESAQLDVMFAFKAFNQHLPKISGEQLQFWYDMDHPANGKLEKGEVAMDGLYDNFKIVEKFIKLKQLNESINR